MSQPPSNIANLVAARLRPVRKAPPYSLRHTLSTADRHDEGPDPSLFGQGAPTRSEYPRSETGATPPLDLPCVLTQDQVQSLLGKLRGVISAAQARSSHPAEAFRLIQACVDTTVDAVELLLAETHPDGSMLAGELRAVGFLSMKSGGCNDVAKNGLDRLEKVIDRAASLFCVTSQSPAIGEVAAANYASTRTATNDAELAEEISRLTQLDVLTQTCNQYARTPSRLAPNVLEITSP